MKRFSLYAILLCMQCGVLPLEHSFSEASITPHDFFDQINENDKAVLEKICMLNALSMDNIDTCLLVKSDHKIHELDLSNKELDTIPPAISQLTELEHLNLAGNRLHSLPDSIVNLTFPSSESTYSGGHHHYSPPPIPVFLGNNYLCSLSLQIEQWIQKYAMQYRSIDQFYQSQKCETTP